MRVSLRARSTLARPRWALLGAVVVFGLAVVLVRETGLLASPEVSGVVLASDWSTATGTSRAAVTDGGRWGNYWEFNRGTGVQLLSVVSGGPGGRNALRVLQRGTSYAAAIEQDNMLPPSTDYYVRFYMRNDDTSQAGDHTVEPGLFAPAWSNLIYMRKSSNRAGWKFVNGLFGCQYTYPIGYFGPSAILSRGVWYRFEFWVHFVDATHIQLHPRVYDGSGTLLWSDADFRQSDYGSASWNGRSDWTLASFYGAGYGFCVDPPMLRNFAIANNGQADAIDTGLSWYFAGVEIRTDWWPGP
jgi:hypothetical protein